MEILDEEFYPEFRRELASLLNKYSMDSVTDIPDFILAGHLASILMQLPSMISTRDRWFGFDNHLTRENLEPHRKEKTSIDEGEIS